MSCKITDWNGVVHHRIDLAKLHKKKVILLITKFYLECVLEITPITIIRECTKRYRANKGG